MTAAARSERERAEQEAADWLVLLAEDAGDAGVRARFAAWQSASPLNAESWARACRVYDLIGQAPPLAQGTWSRPGATDPATTVVPLRRGGARTRQPWRRAGGIGLAALAALLLLSIVPDVLLRLTADAVTTTAEVRTLVLEDGTRVALAPESAVDVDYTVPLRQVRLLRGEAFFEVAANPQRPFQVTAGETAATVLGTAFAVRRTADGSLVAVAHGRVRVQDASTAPPTTAELGAGDWIRLTRDGATAQGNAPTDQVADWRRGEFVARDRPVGEIVAALAPYFGGAILLRNEAFAAQRVSGIYDLRQPVATLRALGAAYGARVYEITPWLLVVAEP